MVYTGLKNDSLYRRLIKNRLNYSYHKTFGVSPLDEIPSEYTLISPILNQFSEPKCTGFNSVAIREPQEGKAFDPHYFYEAEGKINGKVSLTGYSIHTQMKTGCNGGFKPTQSNEDPAKYNQLRYFEITKYGDLFDGIRSAMWKGRGEKMCASIGLDWKQSWIYSKIPTDNNFKDFMGYHAVKCAGWTRKMRNGQWVNSHTKEVYMVIQNSWGEDVGDKGLYYFSRELVNKYFDYHYCWSEIEDPNVIKTLGLIKNLAEQVIILLKKLIYKI